MSMVAALVSATAAVTGVLEAWPQFARIVLRGDATGVSALTWTLALASGLVWEAIGILERVPALIVFNILYSAGTGAVLVTLARHRPSARRVFLGGLGATAVALLLGSGIGGRVAVSVLGVVLSMVMFLPQAVAVVRRPATGVSAATWWLSLASTTCWGGYGVLLGKLVLIAPSLVMAPMIILILWRLHTRDPRPAPTPE